MQSLKYTRWVVSEPQHLTAEALLRFASAALAKASRALAALAHGLAKPAAPTRDPRLEFYSEAGAPEGALYLDGELVGYVEGVRRL
ncbi:MAG: hypothetical protein JSR59_07035 [Proteobacteria bacterium]|nr:hypothetical protein [Pseudomonadota bacterium]